MQTREIDPTDIFAVRPFLRTLSYRDFFTSISLALFATSLQALVRFYAQEPWLESVWGSLMIMIPIFTIPINHVLYKIEHKRSNNYMGRVSHDFVFVGAYWLVSRTYTYLLTNEFEIGLGKDTFIGILAIILFILLIMLFEGGVALLKRLLNLLKWNVL